VEKILVRVFVSFSLVALGLCNACDEKLETGALKQGASQPLPIEFKNDERSLPLGASAPSQKAELVQNSCLKSLEKLGKQALQPGTPSLDKNRAQILAQSRSVPVVFRRAPRAANDLSLLRKKLRRQLRDARDPASVILEILRKTRGNYPARRQVFLSEQYLYADKPLLALRLSQILRLDHLFSKEKELIIERGNKILRLKRIDGRYWLPADESLKKLKRKHNGRLASLLLFDRVRAIDGEFKQGLHIDLRRLQNSLGFSRAQVVAMTQDRMELSLQTYGVKSRALVAMKEGALGVECEFVQGSQHKKLAKARALWLEDQRLIEPILTAAHQMIARRLPFDEPKTEEGQQDGLLRIQFRKAYRRYQSTYEFNGDNYYVFDGYGRPRLPQVCIDFITDAFDWGTGGGWPVRGEKRMRRKGALHFSSLGIENPRSIESLASFADLYPDWFDMDRIPKEQQVKFRYRKRFFEALARDEARYRRGDIVFIYGLRDDEKFHYHSFLIDQKDPITGVPTVVLANAGPPQARSWEGEMQNAPQRKIVARMRVRRETLRRAHAQALKHPGVPLKAPEPVSVELEGASR